MHSNPGIISQYCELRDDQDDTSESLLESVLDDLRVLHDEKLSERINEWHELIREELLDALDADISAALLSPYKQYDFLKEHLQHHEILWVLASLDGLHPFIIRQLDTGDTPSEQDVFYPEYLAALSHILHKSETYTLDEVVQLLDKSISLLEEKVKRIVHERRNIIDIMEYHDDELRMIYLYLYRSYKLYGEIIIHTDTKDTFLLSADSFAKAYDAFDKSGREIELTKYHMKIAHASSLWNAGKLEEALEVFEDVIGELDTVYDEEIDGIEDTLGIGGDDLEETLSLDERDDHFLLYTHVFLMITQLMLEMAHGLGEYDNVEQFALYSEVSEDLVEIEEQLEQAGLLEENTPSSIVCVNAFRFSYGWYLRGGGEYEEAKKYLGLIQEDNTCTYWHAAQELLTHGKFSFIIRKPPRHLRVVR